MEGAKAGVVLRAGLAEPDVLADDFDDVGLVDLTSWAKLSGIETVVRCQFSVLSLAAG